MASLRLNRRLASPGPVPPHQARAADHLQYIRDTMERAGSFTAVSGWGQALVGTIGLAAAALAMRVVEPALWLTIWLGVAVAGATIAAVAISRKANRLGIPMFSRPARRFALAFATPLAAGAVLTAVFYRDGLIQHLPGMWLLLFGTAVVSGGAMSVRLVPTMGFCFMAVAIAAVLVPAAWGDLLMGVGFGGLNIVFGVLIAVKHGG